ncbi:MAG TPA: hypothetical protein VMR96_05325, partial [Solirubrobacterales bacterium]|nr:hypothetical protein [Solirubrobacterales bacterium]
MRLVAAPPRPLVILLTFALSAVVSACGGSNSLAERRVAATRFLPSNLETTRPVEGDPRNAKIRIYTDAAVRALPRWKEDITEQVDYANQLLQPLVGVKLTIESFRDWERTGAPDDALRELAQLDKADDVAWVIGYVAPADAASTTMTALGDAQPLGHHVTVRAWAEKPEVEALAGRLPDAKDPERDEV